ncbi:MAG: hypothetical protein AAF488_03490 [Planctomycetota bacterium]
MNRALVVIVGLLVLGGGSWFLWPRDDVEQIHGVLEDLRDAFNDASPRRVVNCFTDDWTDAPTGCDRDTLRAVMIAFFRAHQDRDTGEFTRDVVLDEGEVAVEVRDESSATASATLAFRSRVDESKPRVIWRIEVEADFRVERGSWKIAETRWNTLEGRRPFSL